MIIYVKNPKDARKDYSSSSMNSLKMQNTIFIYRNPLHFYTLTKNYQKKKLRKQLNL